MNITCSALEIASAVLKVQKAVSTKSSSAALEGILIKTKEDSIELCGYDLELGIKTKIHAQIHKEGEIVLSAKIFSEIVKKLPNEKVTIIVDEKLVTDITSGESRFSIMGISAEEFPATPTLDQTTTIDVNCSALKKLIKQTIFAIAEEDTKPVHMGTLFEITDKKLTLVSVDGYRFAMSSASVTAVDSLSFVVPGKTLNELLKVLSEEDKPIHISVGRRHILFTTETFTVISRLLEGDFLDYKSALPKTKTTTVRTKTRDLIAGIERTSLLISDKFKSPIRCIFSENTIKLSCTTTLGNASDKIQGEIQGENIEIGFNNKYMLDALRNVDCDELLLEMNGPLAPLKILPPAGDSFVFLVLPIKLKTGGV